MATPLRAFRLSRLAFIGVLISAPALWAAAQSVVDGNTVKLDDLTYRLWGMDAPNIDQTCGRDWPAGQEATKALTLRWLQV
jgi:endonuclease YncB( thermonuclease family)